MANFLSKIAGVITGWFTSGKAKRDAQLALEYAAKALPFLRTAADVVTTLTPTGIDDAAWAVVKSKYPNLFNGTVQTPDELKGYALQVAAELLKQKYPQVDKTVAVLATQFAFTEARGKGEAPNVVPAPPSTAGLILNVEVPPKSPLAI
jgi:hypothetical protein